MRKRQYALLQTPVFVEEFILDRTLEPALEERPLEGFRMIDPTCGSGHFLLGSFDRLLDRWHRHAPNLEIQARVQSALDAIHGVDLNPFAVAIARFRLTVAALAACGLRLLEDAPAFKYHLAVGDSLDPRPGSERYCPAWKNAAPTCPSTMPPKTRSFSWRSSKKAATMRSSATHRISSQGQGTQQDLPLQVRQGLQGQVCADGSVHGPVFRPGEAREQSGWVGQITGNAFMDREFGAPLIEKFLPTRDLRLVEDTSGAHIPAHGTPTVIIVGRNQPPASDSVRAVLGVRGENGKPDNPAEGHVWTSIVNHVDDVGWDDTWITVADLDRKLLATHPWSLRGGGAIELAEALSAASPRRLDAITSEIGIVAVIGEEDAFELRPSSTEPSIPVVIGENVRDFTLAGTPRFWPYDNEYRVTDSARRSKWMWPYRRLVSGYLMFGKTRAERGMQWLEYGMLAKSKLRTPLSITFAFVSTHNHFALDRGGKVFKQSAPVIKLPKGAGEDEHLGLTGVLNSSTACFWLKQVSHDKGGQGINEGAKAESWERFYEFTSMTLQDYPLPSAFPLKRAQLIDSMARELSRLEPSVVCATKIPSREVLDFAHKESEAIRARMIAEQEELDWETYRLYGLIRRRSDLRLRTTCRGSHLGSGRSRSLLHGPAKKPHGSMRHESTRVTEIPSRWPAAYQELVRRRLEVIAEQPFIRLLEKPEYKRRWLHEPWNKRQERALRGWLLDRLEDRRFWFNASSAAVAKSVGQLADEVTRRPDMVSVLTLWEGRPDVPVTDSLVRLLEDEAVPFLSAYRYKDSGLRKREAWEETWTKQRREDAGEKVEDFQVPPKYTSADFRRSSYWRARGKLDVPKERFILYSDVRRQGDSTPMLGSSAWDHAQQALALASIIQEREQEGWDDERLIPLVAGLAELQPWVEQWHTEVISEYGASYAEICREELDQRAAQVGKTVAELAAWRPAAPARGRKKAAKG